MAAIIIVLDQRTRQSFRQVQQSLSFVEPQRIHREVEQPTEEFAKRSQR